MKKTKAKKLIFAYGFDAAGFNPALEPIETSDYVIHFIPHGSPQSLEEADGIVTLSGIFERFSFTDGMGRTSVWVQCDKDHLARREKEVTHTIQGGGWIAFLLRQVDNVDGRFEDTDLAKKYLNEIFTIVEAGEPIAHIKCKADEFAGYLHDFGIARTTFSNARTDYEPRALATANSQLVAAEFLGKCFFLPLQSVEKSRNILTSLVTKCVESILEYKRRNDLYLPGWVEGIEFNAEKQLQAEVQGLEQEISKKREELLTLRRFKGILSSSGNTLNALVVEVLRDYFQLDVRSKEEFIEDAIIYIEGNPGFVVEIKGVKGGLKREYINQVDSHRERLGVANDVPGLLIINDFSDIDGLAERKAQTFDALQLKHAEKLNVKVLRTTMLVEIMQVLEADNERDEKFVELCLAGQPIVQLPKRE
jgi:hypothetical protein